MDRRRCLWENIFNNTVSNNFGFGIQIGGSNWLKPVYWGSVLKNNTINDNRQIGLNIGCMRASVENNTLNFNKRHGIQISSTYQTFKNNTLNGNSIFITWTIPYYGYYLTHTIDTTNTVNGKPVYFIKNQTGGQVPPGQERSSWRIVQGLASLTRP